MKSEIDLKDLSLSDKKVPKILYDDRCELCIFSTGLISGMDLETIPLDRTDFQNSDGVILKDENGNIYIGFDAIFHLTARAKVLFPFLPAMFLLKISRLGNLAYAIVSRKRHNRKIQWLFSFLNRMKVRDTS